MDYCKDHIEVVKKVQELESSTKSAHHRLNELETANKCLREMVTSVQVMATNLEHQGREISTIKNDVKELKERPAKKWDLIVTVIITSIASGLVGFIVSQLMGR